MVWDSSLAGRIENGDNHQNYLPIDYQRKIRTSRLQVEILRHPSDVETKYDLFQRLNRGGETANAQEVRNCLCVMANESDFLKIKALAKSADVSELFPLTETAIEKQQDVEWLMRIMAHSYADYSPRQDVESFVDDSMKEILTSNKTPTIIEEVACAFQLMKAAVGDKALLPSLGTGSVANRVSLRQIEAIAVGVTSNIATIKVKDDPAKFIAERISEFWEQEEVQRMSAAGLSPSARIPRTVPFGKAWFSS